MDLLTALSNKSSYSKNQLQLIIGAWVFASLVEKKPKISLNNGDVAEGDYNKASLYSLLYAIYRSVGQVRSEHGQKYEFTFNTWGYAWPEAWGKPLTTAAEPERYGQNAYAGLYHSTEIRKYVDDRGGNVHIIEMGCGTGAGANWVCGSVLPACTYNAVDMQAAAIETCRRKFVPAHAGRLEATCVDATQITMADGSADMIAVNETHVTEIPGVVTAEDEKFFQTAHRLMKPGGYLVWGNAIPDATWKPCFKYLEGLGMKVEDAVDVTREAVRARDEDKARIDTYVDQAIDAFHAFKIPGIGEKRRREAEVALKNFARNPGTNLYDNMVNGTDTYKVVRVRKAA